MAGVAVGVIAQRRRTQPVAHVIGVAGGGGRAAEAGGGECRGAGRRATGAGPCEAL